MEYINSIILGISTVIGAIAGGLIVNYSQGLNSKLEKAKKSRLNALHIVNFFFTEEEFFLDKLSKLEDKPKQTLKIKYRKLAKEKTSFKLNINPAKVEQNITNLEKELIDSK